MNRALLEDAGCRSIGLAVAYAVTQVPAQEVIEAIAPKLFQAQGLSAPGLVKIIMDGKLIFVPSALKAIYLRYTELQKGDPFQMLPEDYGVMRQQFAEFLIERKFSFSTATYQPTDLYVGFNRSIAESR